LEQQGSVTHAEHNIRRDHRELVVDNRLRRIDPTNASKRIFGRVLAYEREDDRESPSCFSRDDND